MLLSFCEPRDDVITCALCGQNKPCEEFVTVKQLPHGHNRTCKRCARDRCCSGVCSSCGQPCGYRAKKCKSCHLSEQTGKENSRWQGGKFVNDDGYVRVRRGNRYVGEHRVIMEEHPGRALLPNENVHHINSVRHDNRIENLELWTRPQPKGIRVEDALAWAREIIDIYGD